jgi:hypothetical protein
MLKDTELQAIREQVLLEPEESLARILLAEVDELRKAKSDNARRQARAMLQQYDDITDEEAERVLVAIETGNPPNYEITQCRRCNGSGSIFKPGCIGGRHEKCSGCHGKGKRSQVVVPPVTP